MKPVTRPKHTGWPARRSPRFFRQNPAVAARYFLPAVGALVHLYGSTDATVVKEVARRCKALPCTPDAIRQVLEELRTAPLPQLEEEHGVGPEHAPIFSRVRQYLLRIPESFWDAVYREMEEPAKKGKIYA